MEDAAISPSMVGKYLHSTKPSLVLFGGQAKGLLRNVALVEEDYNNNNNFISIALFHVKHAQLR